ncbi:hypothetical protein OOZ15_18490 [Galbibacter sp. EGI 63066]|uniref:hypothetical protein n=1 Tax=Galbibacter sp. EGI 63066 TaxID=2993559 RepID=UPI00224994EA|nr:hypothetical protein [Galbibacter sp. EGI 63066]MCX2681946.1 hypothetical protein [Galbibacter sp. EGI 63066]
MATLLGEYLNKLGIVKEKVRSMANVKKPRMNDLCNKGTAKPSPEEFYRIVLIGVKLADREEFEFNKAVDEIFPDRAKNNFLEEYSRLPSDIQFLKRHTLKQSDVENKIGMAENKISRLANEKTKDLLAVELICFMEGLNYNLLDTFKEIYGEIKIDADEKVKNSKNR